MGSDTDALQPACQRQAALWRCISRNRCVLEHKPRAICADGSVGLLELRVDRGAKVCHGSAVRRLVASLVMLAFVAATAAPALAACRRTHECCCGVAPANALCAPDCCERVKASGALLDSSIPFRHLAALVGTLGVRVLPPELAQPILAQPAADRLVGLHERAGPPIPLRI
jgi:hypothetical protein